MFLTDDPLMDFARHDREQAKQLAQLPECDHCHKPIQDEHYFDINGDVMCERCLIDNFRRENFFDGRKYSCKSQFRKSAGF